MNNSSDSPERADSPEPMLTQREARSMSGADADPGGIGWAQRETSPASPNPVSPASPYLWRFPPRGLQYRATFLRHLAFLQLKCTF